jgi:uncharacterized SAM-binding protein YcdF (DUF218 family)
VIFFSFILFAVSFVQVWTFQSSQNSQSADVAIVLGAGVFEDSLSPVFRERVNHAIQLYQDGSIKKIVFTGGVKYCGNSTPESEVAKNYALSKGVAIKSILTEDFSTNTFENLFYAKQVMSEHYLKNAVIVSDPLHMKRAMFYSERLKINSNPSGTPTSMYRSLNSRIQFALSEATFLVYAYFTI